MGNVYVYDSPGSVVGILDEYESLIWRMSFDEIGDFEIVTSGTPEHIELLQEGRILHRGKDITAMERKGGMRISRVNITYDPERGYILTVSGEELKAILRQRVIWNQLSFEDEDPQHIITLVVGDNTLDSGGPREIPGFSPIMKDSPETVSAQVYGENLADWVISMCKSQKCGWDIYTVDTRFFFVTETGTDRSADQSDVPPVVFSPGYDNLKNADYTKTTEGFANVALVAGEGEGSSRKTATAGSASGLARYELFCDASSMSSNSGAISGAEYIKMLQQYGTEQLADHQETAEFSAEMIISSGLYQFGQDFFLGDIVTVDNGRGIRTRARLTEVIESESSAGVETIGTFIESEV